MGPAGSASDVFWSCGVQPGVDPAKARGPRPEMKPSDAHWHLTGASSAVSGEAVEALFAACQAELLGMLYFQTGNSETARQAFQECFAECWRRRDTLPDANGLRAWVFREALAIGRRLRAATAGRPAGPIVLENGSTPGRSPLSAQDSADWETKAVSLIRQCLMDMGPDEQEVFLLRQNAQLPYGEIAQMLGVSLETVKARMRTALERLRGAMGENP